MQLNHTQHIKNSIKMQKEVIKVSEENKKDRYFATMTGFCKIMNFENRYNKDWNAMKKNTIHKLKFPFEYRGFEFSKVDIEREKDLKIEKA